MYHYVEDKVFLGRMKGLCSDIVNQLVQLINKEEYLYVRAYLVGSGAKNLITQNANEAMDLDYNLEITECYGFDINDCRGIKNYIGERFDEILSRNGWRDCQYCSSVFTTEQRVFSKGNKTPFSIDLCIVKHNQNCWERLICENTAFVTLNRYYWNQAPNSTGLAKKVEQLKKEHYWEEVRNIYLDKKNMYLRRNDRNHSSFIIYIETINEAYDKYCQ